MQEQQRIHVMEGSEAPGKIRSAHTPQAFIPCPVCRGPIAIDEPSEPLPPILTCSTCGSMLER